MGQAAVSLIISFPDGDNYKELFGALDNAFLVAYAIGMFIRYLRPFPLRTSSHQCARKLVLIGLGSPGSLVASSVTAPVLLFPPQRHFWGAAPPALLPVGGDAAERALHRALRPRLLLEHPRPLVLHRHAGAAMPEDGPDFTSSPCFFGVFWGWGWPSFQVGGHWAFPLPAKPGRTWRGRRNHWHARLAEQGGWFGNTNRSQFSHRNDANGSWIAPVGKKTQNERFLNTFGIFEQGPCPGDDVGAHRLVLPLSLTRCAMGWCRRRAGPLSWRASGTGSGRESECFSGVSPLILVPLGDADPGDADPGSVPARRGLIMGIWNSHTSVGNILGSLIAGIWVSSAWGLSFIVPGIIIAAVGVLCFFFLVECEWRNADDAEISRIFHLAKHFGQPQGLISLRGDAQHPLGAGRSSWAIFL